MNKHLFTALAMAGSLSLASPHANATLMHFSANLDGPSEFPSAASTGTGLALIDLDDVAHTLHLRVTFSGLTGATTASHIHCCVSPRAATPTVGVATTLPTFPGFPLGVSSGTYESTLDLTSAASFSSGFLSAHGGTPAGAEAFLASGIIAGDAYLNIHTNVFPGGEIRGFLRPVPEPGTISLIALGFSLGLLPMVWRQR